VGGKCKRKREKEGRSSKLSSELRRGEKGEGRREEGRVELYEYNGITRRNIMFLLHLFS
jgi:hypothetical protein